MDQIISLSAQIMTGDNLEHSNSKCNSPKTRSRSFHGANTMFLQSLETCLTSTIGTEYFYRYLHQNHCEELAFYLQIIQKFKAQSTEIERYGVVKEMTKSCIEMNGTFAINISYETRKKYLDDFKNLKSDWVNHHHISIPLDYFKDVEMEMRRLIVKTHWKKFVDSVQELHNSANVDHLIIE